MLSAHDNDTLTLTGAGTAMGDLLRRFWLPVLLAQELPAPDCDPVRAAVCGQELVAFRDSEGRIGLLDARCPHRGAELFWGRNEECGLRCVYHGWKFDVDGVCVDLPSEPAESNFKDKVRIGVYPAREAGGLIWGYFGPAEALPPFPRFEFAAVPPGHRFVSKKLQECNWAQSLEGAIDTAHFSFLHMPKEVDDATPQIVRWMKNDGAPRFTVIPHDAGFVIGGARSTETDDLYWRITQFFVPNHSLAPGSMGQDSMNGQAWVPIDDTHCWVYCYTWNPWRPITERERTAMAGGAGIHSEVDRNWRPVRNRDNDYLIDRQAQRTTSFTGVKGISEQDAYIQDSQGAIVDRTKEHLGTTDVAIIEWRKLMLKLARDLREGEEPAYARRPEAYWLRSGSAVAPPSLPFAALVDERTRIR
jgi:phenylpropionate dioxygenase-like ring-hydroxylating dioxygenase large terminal subunit